jgi:hypothetical protein
MTTAEFSPDYSQKILIGRQLLSGTNIFAIWIAVNFFALHFIFAFWIAVNIFALHFIFAFWIEVNICCLAFLV